MVADMGPFIAKPDEAVLGWIVLFAPLIAAAAILLLAPLSKKLASTFALSGILIAFLSAAKLFINALEGSLRMPLEARFSWISLPGLEIPIGVLLDPGSLLMCLIVTGVGALIFAYSTSYMRRDAAYARYFGMLSLFAFSMLMIVLANNFIQLFVGWELVGFSSYMLIGHWYAKPAAAAAGKKAFMVNRVADFAFLLGILLLWSLSGDTVAARSFEYAALRERLPLLMGSGALTLAGLLLFCGPVGKSAQFPLHVWLPDAMEGPTPVSALIHAATMVAAGVYMLYRTFWIFEALPGVLLVIAWVGALTAFLAAALAFVENDMKRILAYSTLSQLGYMVLAIGVAAPVAGMYHLTTHAFFKALLFLGAGSVLHATHELDIWKLGGLRRSMPTTSITFLIGALALIGMPGLSGFFSKEAVLGAAHGTAPVLYWIGMVTAAMTAFYTARLWFVAFMGKEQTRAHESDKIITTPLLILAILAIVAGYAGIPNFLDDHAHHHFDWGIVITSLVALVIGVGLAWLIYAAKVVSRDSIAHALGSLIGLLRNRYFIDDLYNGYVAEVQQKWIAGIVFWFEQNIIIGAMVNGSAYLARHAGNVLRLLQTGQVQAYVAGLALGIAALLYATVLR